jgi:hypothetical protein
MYLRNACHPSKDGRNVSPAAVQWLTFLNRIRKVTGSKLALESTCPKHNSGIVIKIYCDSYLNHPYH